MAIVTDIFKENAYWVWVDLHNRTIKYYEKLKYDIPRYIDKCHRMSVAKGTKILVKIIDLPRSSHVKVTKVCDFCGCKSENQQYDAILRRRRDGDGFDRCKKCGKLESAKKRKINVPYEKTLKYNYKSISEEWHPTKNGELKPENIYANSGSLYWWLCPSCGSEYDMSTHQRAGKGNSCPYCSGDRVNQTNCIAAKLPEIVQLLWDISDGYKYTIGSNQRVDFRCPLCESKIQNKIIQNIVKYGLHCPSCSDGVSYPEKFVIKAFHQLNIQFDYQKTFKWSRITNCVNEKLNGYKRYDFYIPSTNSIVEVHGIQHYYQGFENLSSRSLEDEQENDKIKYTIAFQNGIATYTIIDCSKSELEHIKYNIINSNLSTLFDLDKVDWLKCHEYACGSLVKIACDLFRNNNTSSVIAKTLQISAGTVRKYLRQGTKLGWCKYDAEEEILKNYSRDKGIPIVKLSLDGLYISEYKNAKEAASKLCLTSPTNITATCKGKQKTAAGFKWMYKWEYEARYLDKI